MQWRKSSGGGVGSRIREMVNGWSRDVGKIWRWKARCCGESLVLISVDQRSYMKVRASGRCGAIRMALFVRWASGLS